MRMIVAAMAIGAASSSIGAAQPNSGRWVYITESDGDGGYMVLGDRSTVAKDGNETRLWTTTVYRSPTPERVKQFIELNEVDCTGRRYRVIDRKAYDASRAPIFTSREVMPWHDASPDSVGEEVANAACRGFEVGATMMDDPFKQADFILRIEAADSRKRH